MHLFKFIRFNEGCRATRGTCTVTRCICIYYCGVFLRFSITATFLNNAVPFPLTLLPLFKSETPYIFLTVNRVTQRVEYKVHRIHWDALCSFYSSYAAFCCLKVHCVVSGLIYCCNLPPIESAAINLK